MRYIWMIIGLVLSLCTSGFGDDWPTYRHDNHRSGVTGQKLDAASLSSVWVYRAPASPQTAWPKPAKWDAYANIRGLSDMRNYDSAFHVAVVGHRLFFGSSVDDALHCLDIRTT